MSVLHTEAREQHFRIAVGIIIAVAIGIKEQIRRLQNEHAAVTQG